MYKKFKSPSAFTLAEVLITLGIIGVVAAVTMPTLVQQYKERETVERVNQFYSIFSQAYLMAIQEHGTFDQWGLKYAEILSNEDGTYTFSDDKIKYANNFFEIMSKYLKYADFKPYTSAPITNKDELIAKRGVQLANGVAIRAVWMNTEEGCKTDNMCGNIYVVTDAGTMSELRADGNVYKRNKTFSFLLRKDKIEPDGLGNNTFKSGCLSGNNYSQCTGWVIRNKNMDYLHCNDLDMNTKTKCK